jgi:hypothetical protein
MTAGNLERPDERAVAAGAIAGDRLQISPDYNK